MSEYGIHVGRAAEILSVFDDADAGFISFFPVAVPHIFVYLNLQGTVIVRLLFQY